VIQQIKAKGITNCGICTKSATTQEEAARPRPRHHAAQALCRPYRSVL